MLNRKWIHENLKRDFEIYPLCMCMRLAWCVYMCMWVERVIKAKKKKEKKRRESWGEVIQIAGNFLEALDLWWMMGEKEIIYCLWLIYFRKPCVQKKKIWESLLFLTFLLNCHFYHMPTVVAYSPKPIDLGLTSTLHFYF